MMRQSGVRLVDTVRRVGRPKVTEKDEERGARVARLRIARGFDSQAKLVADVAERVAKKELAEENGLDRVEYQRVENGENRLTSEAIQVKLATVFGVGRADFDAYAKGELELDALLGGAPRPVLPVPTRHVEADDEHEHRPAALALMRGKFDPEVIESLRLLKTKADAALSIDDWWHEARRLQAMRDGRTIGEDIEPQAAPDVSAQRLRDLAAPKRTAKNPRTLKGG